MTARVWTREELDRVHPLPEPDDGSTWEWVVAGSYIGARESGVEEPNEVWVDEYGCLASSEREPPAAIALPVILASKGMDSLGAMAAEVESLASDAGRIDPGGFTGGLLTRIASVLRRGTVKP